MHDPLGHRWTDEAVHNKQLADAIEAGRKHDEVTVPAAKLSGRAWLIIALIVGAIIIGVVILSMW